MPPLRDFLKPTRPPLGEFLKPVEQQPSFGASFGSPSFGMQTSTPAFLPGAPKPVQPQMERTVPVERPRTVTPDTIISAAKPSLADTFKIPQAIQRPIRTVMEHIKDGLFGNPKDRAAVREMERQGLRPSMVSLIQSEGFLPFLGRTETDKIEHLVRKLEERGTDPERASAIAFYAV